MTDLSARSQTIDGFLTASGFADAVRLPLAGDASSRRYERISSSKGPAVLMDWPKAPDGPPLGGMHGQKPYSAIAHIAESVRPFCAVAQSLTAQGFSAPALLGADHEAGLLLLEDFGDALFGTLIDKGENILPLYEAAVDTLVALSQKSPPAKLPARAFAPAYEIPPFDEAAFLIEAELLMDWYWPAAYGMAPPLESSARYRAIMSKLFHSLSSSPAVLMLRDYHSPNLMWLERREGIGRVGILDFQDALMGPAAYDLASLLQDARRDLSEDLEKEMLLRYVRLSQAQKNFNEDSFRGDYAILGAQRAAKILGIFCRLAKRDKKPHYLAHIPRVWRYMTRNLSHADMGELRDFLDNAFPPATRLTSPRSLRSASV